MKIIMLGESLDRQGGIVSVEKLILKQSAPEIVFQHIPTLPQGSTLHKILVFGQAIGKLLWKLSLGKADLIYIHVSDRGSAFRQTITAMFSFLFRKPVIMHTHSADFHVFFSGLPVGIKQGMSWVFRKCDRFIVLSESWKNYYIKNLGLKTERVMVLPNPVKIPAQVPQRRNSQEVTFVFLGRIGQRKGAFDLIKAFSYLSTEHKTRSKLILAGDGDVEKARILIKALNLVEYITVLDWIDEEQRDVLLKKADVFVLPSYNEGLPMALLEAMSWGLPVITTAVGGIPELVINNKNGLLINPGNGQELLKAMQFMIENENFRISLGNAARASVMHLDVKHYLISLTNVYRSVLL